MAGNLLAGRQTASWRLLKVTATMSLVAVTVATLLTHEAYVLKPHDPEWAHLAPIRWWLLPHVTAGAIALIIGPFQFSSTLRARYLQLHRWLGRTYACAALLSSCLSVYIVATFEAPYNRWSMGTMGALWFASTLFAWLAIRNRDIAQHRLWMARSYGLTLTFVATRFVPDIVLPGLDYIGTTALYWGFIVGALIIPDLLLNGRALVPWGRRVPAGP